MLLLLLLSWRTLEIALPITVCSVGVLHLLLLTVHQLDPDATSADCVTGTASLLYGVGARAVLTLLPLLSVCLHVPSSEYAKASVSVLPGAAVVLVPLWTRFVDPATDCDATSELWVCLRQPQMSLCTGLCAAWQAREQYLRRGIKAQGTGERS